MLLILGSDFLTRASRFIRRIYLMRDLCSLLERRREGFIKLIILYKLAILLASSSSSFGLAEFGGTLVTLLSSY